MELDTLTPYRNLALFARQVVEGFITGRHRSPYHGFSAEFSDYRQYNPGEPTRNIDYRLYGRTDRLYVKQFEEETNLRCQLVIDQSTSMLHPLENQGNVQHPNKLTFSAYASAVLIELLHRQRDAFGLTLLSSQIDLHTPCRSSRLHQQHLLSHLDPLTQPVKASSRPLRHTDLSEPLHLVAEQIHRRSLVAIFTDALMQDDRQDALVDALRHLRHNKHEVILFHTYHGPTERQLDYTSRPHLFVDLESGRQLRLNPAEVADAYRRDMADRFGRLQRTAMQYRIDYQPVDISLGFHQLLLPFLLKRNKSK